MYQIYSNDTLIFDDTQPEIITSSGTRAMNAIRPKLNLTAGAAGSLEFTLTQESAGYNEVKRLSSTIRVLRDREIIWIGRVLSEKSNLWRDRTLVCEGALAFLNDTIVPVEMIAGTAGQILSTLLNAHNGKTGTRSVLFGTTNISGTLTLEAGTCTTYEAVEKLVGTYGGIVRTRIVSGEVYLDWLADYPDSTGQEQSIEFGENLLDFAPEQDCTDFCTAVYVRGAQVPNSDPPTYYNSGWVTKSQDVLAELGRIERFIEMSDLDNEIQLAAEGARYLADRQYDALTLSISALDLHVLNPDAQPFSLLERVHVGSYYHGMDKTFAVIGLSIDLADQSKTGFTLGDPNVAYKRRVQTLTEKTIDAEQQTAEDISKTAAETREYAEDRADEAYAAASADIQEARDEIDDHMNSMSQGYLFIDYNDQGTQGIYIVREHKITSLSEIRDGDNVWKWDSSGFGHTNHYNGASTHWNVALTEFGEINADRIVTGLLLAQYIKLYGDLAVYNNGSATGVVGGYLGYGAGHNASQSTSGIHMFVDNGQVEVIVTSDGARMSYGNYNIYVGSAGVVVSGGAPERGGVPSSCPLTVYGDIYYSGNLTQFTPT